jgi:hypothetical protein
MSSTTIFNMQAIDPLKKHILKVTRMFVNAYASVTET